MSWLLEKEKKSFEVGVKWSMGFRMMGIQLKVQAL